MTSIKQAYTSLQEIKGVKSIYAYDVPKWIIPIVIVLSPFFIIFGIISWIKHKSELKKILSENDGKIVFLYGEYHEFDFLSYFKNHHPAIKCLEVPNHYISDILINHLIRNR